MRRFHLTPGRIVLFLLGVILLLFLLYSVDEQELLRLVLTIPFRWFLLGGLAYLAKCLVRSLRILHVNRLPLRTYPDMLRLWLASSLAAQLLPFKMGELVYLFLLRRTQNVPIPKGVSGAVLLRLLDLLALIVLFIFAALTFGAPLTPATRPFQITFFLLGLAAAGGLGFLLLSSAAAGRWVDRLLSGQRLAGNRVAIQLRSAAADFFTHLQGWAKKDLAAWLGLSLLEWSANFLSFHALLIGLNMQPTLFATVVCVTFAALTAVLPINTIGNFGTQEAGWTAGLVLLGYDQKAALASGFAAHLLTIGYMLVLGGPAWLSYFFTQRGAGTQK